MNAIQTIFECDPQPNGPLKESGGIADALGSTIMEKYNVYWDDYADCWDRNRVYLRILMKSLKEVHLGKLPRKKPTKAKRELCLTKTSFLIFCLHT